MTGETEYGTAVKIFALYGAFFKEVEKELGEEKTLELHRKAHEQMGIETGRKMLSQHEGKAFDLESLAKILQASNQGIGIECELIKGGDKLTLRNLRCPMYDGYRAGGLRGDQAESLCRVGAPAKLGSTMKLLNGNSIYELSHYRVKPDERCVEEITLRR